jgi:hypothetical protein
MGNHLGKLPCEVAVKSVIPSIRALLAIELINTHGMKQDDVASLLGITQTAVSKYAHHVRGAALQTEIERLFEDVVKKVATLIANGEFDRFESTEQMCRLCSLVRTKGIMCEICNSHSSERVSSICKLCFRQLSIKE